MSQENVVAFQQSAEAVNHKDIEAVVRPMDPQIDFVPQRAPVQGSYIGRDAVRRFFADNEETFEVFEVDYPDVRDLGDRVLALGTLRIRGKGSGIETEVASAIVATFREGLIVHFKDFGDRKQALEAVGLRE
jgi:ketosteroid isomerase-like protein